MLIFYHMSKSLLNISNLSKAFNDRKILESIDFAVYENELISILGANGSGKSTLFKIIINLISGLWICKTYQRRFKIRICK